MNTDDNTPQASPAASGKAKALAAAAELGRRRRDLGRRLGLLADERRALEEIRDSLASEEKLLAERIDLAERGREQARGRLGNAAREAVELDGEAQEIAREIAVLEQRCLESKTREKDLGKKINAAERELTAARAGLLDITRTLETSRGTLARMDRKLAARAKDRSS